MKKFIILLTLLFSVIGRGYSHNSGNGELLNRISERLIFSGEQKAQLGTGIAVVSFKINNEGCIEIVQVDASTEAQKNIVTEKLQGYFIQNAPVSSDAIYRVQVKFGE